jgi:hypothetical protein
MTQAQPGFLLSPELLGKVRTTIAKVDGDVVGGGAGEIPVRLEGDDERTPLRSRFFVLTDGLDSCRSASGDEVRVVRGETCGIQFEQIPPPPDGNGKVNQELFDVSYVVRAYNLAIESDDIDEAVPAGTFVEAIRERQKQENSDGEKSFWRILRVIECQCFGPSSSSPPSESSPPSSPPSESSPPSSPPSESSPPSDGSGSESEKSTAIVPASWTPGGYTALFVEESPEVRFDDVIEVSVRQDYCCVPIDPRFIEVCEKGSVRVCGCVPDRPVLVGAAVEGDAVAIQFDKRRPKSSVRLVLRLTGVRRGFAGLRFPSRSKRQFLANERFINSAYPAE